MGKLSDTQKIEMIQKHSTGQYSCDSLARQYNVSGPAIRQMLKRRGIKINNDRAKLARKYTLNEDYFEKIDSEEKAYFLGLLYADGCNQPQRNTTTIMLQERDGHILEKFYKEINCNKPLYFYKKRQKHHQNYLKVEINSQKFSLDLEKLGCVKDKAFIIDFPSDYIFSNNKLIRHFVRGYFDGDGCVGIYRNKKNAGKNGYKNVTCNITSNSLFCFAIKELLQDININCSIVVANKSEHTRTLVIGGNKQAIRFLDWIYKESNVHLNRKYNKYIEIKSYLKERYGY